MDFPSYRCEIADAEDMCGMHCKACDPQPQERGAVAVHDGPRFLESSVVT